MIDLNLEIDIEGNVSIDFIDQKLQILGELIINKVKENIRDMGLISVGGGQYLQGWLAKAKNGRLTIENTQSYSVYLEYGTFGYWQVNGLENFTEPPDPKKRDMTPNQKKAFPLGMQSFAPLRKVILNEAIMKELVTQAFS